MIRISDLKTLTLSYSDFFGSNICTTGSGKYCKPIPKCDKSLTVVTLSIINPICAVRSSADRRNRVYFAIIDFGKDGVGQYMHVEFFTSQF